MQNIVYYKKIVFPMDIQKLTLETLSFLIPKKVDASEVSFGVYPPLTKIQAHKKAHILSPISVFNNSEEKLELQISFRAFRAKDDGSGKIEYYSPKQTPREEFDFLQTVTIKDKDETVKSINLYPKQYKQLNLSFTAPSENTHDYYFSVIFTHASNEPKTKETILNVNTGVATNVLLSVNESSPTTAVISEFSSKPVFLSGPVPFRLKVENTGDSFINTSGKVEIYNIFGSRAGIINLNPTLILANSSKNMVKEGSTVKSDTPIVWSEKFLLGYYTAKATVQIGKDTTINSTTHFLAIPTVFLIIVTIILFIVLSILLRVFKKVNFKES